MHKILSVSFIEHSERQSPSQVFACLQTVLQTKQTHKFLCINFIEAAIEQISCKRFYSSEEKSMKNLPINQLYSKWYRAKSMYDYYVKLCLQKVVYSRIHAQIY
jgi:hypothetical protein